MNAPDTVERLRVLCVDDEPRVLEGLELRLRKHYDVEAAFDGKSALQTLKARGPFAIVISDMRMPGIDGATLLAAIRNAAPDTVRMLLTGYADVESAAAAVNNGGIFRFLTKPCHPDVLMQAMKEAEEQHRLVRAERDLLERTLRGAVQALSDILGLADSESFGRASRIRRLAMAIAEHTKLDPRWPLELAALLSTIGQISLPPEVVKRLHARVGLSQEEQAMVARVPEVTDKLLSPIPRLEAVREILRQASRPTVAGLGPEETSELNLVMRYARILRLAMDCEELESNGQATPIAVAELNGRKGRYEPELLKALIAVKGAPAAGIDVRELMVRQLQPGMVLDEDLVSTSGLRLVAKGYEITPSFVERIRNFRAGTLREPVRVILPRQTVPSKPTENQ
jgi:response regulator RpfG family c-di-GMP phosphodiesterase